MRRLLPLLFGLFAATACRSTPEAPDDRRSAAPVAGQEGASDGAPSGPLADSVVLVTIDTLRADALGVHGGPAHTPVLDRLARTGWDFLRCFSASMLTNPSHASIMTSLYARDHGVYDNESGLRPEARTLAAALQRHRMRTVAVIGFPHLNPAISNLGQGFDKVVLASSVERRALSTTAVALAALDESAPSDPFFLWVHYTDPHAPYEPPDGAKLPAVEGRTPMASARRAAPGFQRHHPWFRQVFAREKTVEALAARYYAEVEAADMGLGALLAGLESRGRLGRTAVVATADHGENLGEHQLYFHHGGLYRETVHVPLLIYAPGLEPLQIRGLVETVDIAPTILALVGAPFWEPMRGHSLLEVGRGLRLPRTVAFSEHMLGQLAAVRSDAGTLIVHRVSSNQFPTYELTAGRLEYYDLRVDPDERRALAADGEEAQALITQLERLLGPRTELAARRATVADRENLRALGYLE